RQQPDIGAASEGTLHEKQVGGVILDVEHRAYPHIGSKLWPGDRLGFRRTNRGRERVRRIQFDPEHAADADAAFRGNLASHEIDQSLAHDQSDAGAFGCAALLPKTIERLEQLT